MTDAHTRPRRSWRAVAVVAASVLGLAGAAVPSASAAQGYERLLNGTFDSGSTDPWWSSANTPIEVADGKLCADVPAGTANPWDAMIGQNAVPLEDGQPYTLKFDASADRPFTIRAVVQLNAPPYPSALYQSVELTPEARTFTFDFTSNLETDQGQVAFQLGGSEAARVCLDNISLVGGQKPPAGQDPGLPIRVNQVGYAPKLPKRATLRTDATSPVPWQLVDSAGSVVASGTTTVFGADETSGDFVHLIDFSGYEVPGTGYRLRVGEQESHPFDISSALYDELSRDAIHFFYHQRSGTPIEAEYVGEAYARPAGHLGVAPNQGDTQVPCVPGECDYTLDVRGGWYDAGDHGKYVVNGGIATWQLLNAYERTQYVAGAGRAALADGTLRIPERANGVPDILDEARWELEFLLRMQVPDGEPKAGMAHHKIHDAQWTGLPTRPHEDPQPRYLHKPSTAATLNLAAVAAQCARIWRRIDPAFSARCLTAATRAWAAAKANPADYAPSSDNVGGGAYEDTDVTDEFYWAAAELFITTGGQEYRTALTESPHYKGENFTAGGFGWQQVAALGDLSLALVPNRLGAAEISGIRQAIAQAGDRYLAAIRSQGYPNPYLPGDGKYVWGSNSQALNNALVLAAAADYTGQARYRDGVFETLDYILGRNGLGQSYVTGYGEKASKNQHHRFWAHQLDPSLPNPPAGSLAGGPNSWLQDPVAARLQGCAPQKCYIDDVGSYSTDEVAINWNSALAWVAVYAAEQARAAGATSCRVTYKVTGQWGDGFTAEVSIRDTGSRPINGWTLAWTFAGDQRITAMWNAVPVQDGRDVRAKDAGWNAKIPAGGAVSFGFRATHSGQNPVPTRFALNGVACAS